MTVKYFRLFTSEANASDALTSLLNLDYAIDENWVSSALLINDFAYLPSGQEHRLGSEFYLDLREKVLALAAEAQGLQKFDPTASSQAMFTEFDTLMYKNISELIPVTLYEASKPGVWSYITLRALPDVANWRYPNKHSDATYERHLGSARNIFRRIWIRVFFADTSSGLLTNIGEDQAVAIFERTAVISNPKIAEASLKALNFVRKVTSRNDVYRDAMIRVRRLASVETIDILSPEDADALILGAFIESLGELAPELVRDET